MTTSPARMRRNDAWVSRLLGACMLDGVDVAEKSSSFADPDANLAAVGILSDIRVSVRRDHEDTDDIRGVVLDRSISRRTVRER